MSIQLQLFAFLASQKFELLSFYSTPLPVMSYTKPFLRPALLSALFPLSTAFPVSAEAAKTEYLSIPVEKWVSRWSSLLGSLSVIYVLSLTCDFLAIAA